MATVKLDGLEIDLPAEAASAVQSFARDMERQLKSVTAERDEFATKLDAQQEEIDALAYEKEAAEGRADAFEERVTELEQGSSSRIDTAELDQLVSARLATLQKLAPAFAEDFHFDGIDNEDLYAQAFENLTGSAPREDAESGYIHGVVDGILAARADADDQDKGEDDNSEDEGDEPETKEDRADSTTSLRDALKGAGRGNASPVDTYRSKQAEAWKRPLTATK
jgi:TATA-binding protein-associated factor Taf7